MIPAENRIITIADEQRNLSALLQSVGLGKR
jgi:hypothetical protein